MATKKTADKKTLLKVRKIIKSKKPTFLQQDHHKKARLSKKWKRPTGLQSKMRHQFRGYSRRVKQGWRSPEAIRGYHMSGYEPIMIHNVAGLSTIKVGQAAIIAGTVGMKKKLEILAKAQEMKIVVINVKAEKIQSKVDALKKAKAEEKQAKENKKKSLEEAAKKAEKKKKDDAAADKTDDEKKADEKKAKDDVIMHQQ